MNVQNLIAKGIREQLFRHEFLVLPDFGGFILKKGSANFSATNGMLFPPTKTIGFNLQLKQNDGVLQQWLSTELKCTAAESASHLKEFSDYSKAILSTKGRFNLDGIGFFYTDLENNISFEPLKDNFLRSSFGLEAIVVKELEIEVQETIRSGEKNATDFTDRILTHLETEQKENTRRFKTYHKVAYTSLGVIALLSVLFFVVSNTKFSGKIRSAIFHSDSKSTYAPITYSELKLSEAAAEKKDYVADANGVAAVELEPNKIVAVQALPVETRVEHKKYPPRIRGNFELVVGCFAIESNARKLVRQLKAKGIEAFISGKNEKGLHVVSGGGFNTKEDALVQLNILKGACCPKVWIRKVN